MKDHNPEDESTRISRIIKENEELRQKYGIEGGLHNLEPMDPDLENVFLRQIAVRARARLLLRWLN